MRGDRVCALIIVLTLATVAFGADAGATTDATRAKSACDLLTSDDITAVFPDAPLDPGPTKVRAKANKNFTRCEWDDHSRDPATTELFAQTFLARRLSKGQKKLLTTVVPGSSSRPLTSTELEGLGKKGLMEIELGGAYASVGVQRGDEHFIVSVGYRGPGPVSPITDAQMLELAKVAAARA